MRGSLDFVVKKQVSILLRGTHSTIMPPLGNYQNWFFFCAKCSIQGQEIKKKIHTARVCTSSTAEFSTDKQLQMHSEHSSAFLHLLPPNEEVPNESLWKDLHISPNFWKIKWTGYYNGSVLIFSGLHTRKI